MEDPVVRATLVEHGGGQHLTDAEASLLATPWAPGRSGYLTADKAAPLTLVDDVAGMPVGSRDLFLDKGDVMTPAGVRSYALSQLPGDDGSVSLVDDGRMVLDEGRRVLP